MARARRNRYRPPDRVPGAFTSFNVLCTVVGLFVALNIGILVFTTTRKDRNKNTFMTSPEPKKKKSKTTMSQVFSSPDNWPPDDIVRDLDAILVLGGGVPLSLEEPPVFVQRRCDDAAHMVKRHSELTANNNQNKNNLNILCLSAGTAHLPQLLGKDGLPVWESTASSAYLLKHYSHLLNPNQVFAETTSYDTIGNAFYARTSFTDLAGWNKLLIITNEFHMPRTRAIFEWIFGIHSSSSSSHPNDEQQQYELYFLESPNVGLSEDAIRARKEREANSLTSVQQHLAPKLTTMQDVWRFLTQEHSLYTAHKLVERGAKGGDEDSSATNDNQQALKESYGGSQEAKSEEQENNKNDKELRAR